MIVYRGIPQTDGSARPGAGQIEGETSKMLNQNGAALGGFSFLKWLDERRLKLAKQRILGQFLKNLKNILLSGCIPIII